MNRRMIKGYLEQDAQYYSESSGTFRSIHEMHPRHAANAARRLLLDADVWAKEAGMNFSADSSPTIWLTRTPLYNALAAQAGF